MKTIDDSQQPISIEQTICLNMIVKNESHIIESTLKNILEHMKIDYWVISDTGSTDNTIEIIENFFKDRGISGEIFNDTWKDFGHNRTKALEHAFDKTDYIFIFDADDLIHGNINLPPVLDKDCYNFQFENPVLYHRSILISNRMRWKYIGVLHEYITPIDTPNAIEILFGNYHVESRHLGNRSKNPNKYLNDAHVLEKGFDEEVSDIWLKHRYAYYCGQSYKDCDKKVKSIEWYKKSLTIANNPQYHYCACINIGSIYFDLKQYSEAIDYWTKSYTYDRERLEGIAKIMEYYYNKGQHFMVSSLYNKFKHIKMGNSFDKIFLDTSKYHFFHYFASISGCYCDEKKSAYDACKFLLLNTTLYTSNTIYNLKFYMKYFKEDGDNKSLLDFFVTYIMNSQIDFKERENAWNIVNSIIKEQLSDKYEMLENSITTQNIDKNSKYAPSKNVLIYTGWMTHLWNDSTLNKKAIGGAEKAVIYLTRNLPKNYTIYIAGHQKEEEIGNIKYINHSNLQKLLDNTIFHSIIVSRYVSFFKEFDNIKCYKMLLSAHDSTGFINFNVKMDINNILLEYNKYIDNVICLTKWHSSNIVERHPFLKEKINIINNGIDISQFIYDKPKVKNKFVWSSCSYRGLIILLNLWGELLKSIPDATLDICSYDTFPKNKEDEKMLEIINKHSSIIHHGKLNTKELYELMSISEYWLYTNTFPETSCITAMEMLMSGVICLYYPLAGLVDTIGSYGIQVKSGNEIESLIDLSEERKKELIKNGKEYALTCSWKNRANRWCRVLNININTNKNIGIFNSFPFHYEMFGFILNYALNNDIEVDIFTNTQNDLGWIDFYREKFNNFNVIDFKKFEGNTNNYSTFFVTTDDDPLFKTEWIDNNVVCLNHYYKIRSPNFKHYLNVANFKDSPLEYSYPCYPLINYKEKKQNTTVCVIGGGNIHTNHNIDIINRLESKNKIILNIFVRKICNTNISGVDTSKFNINFIEDIETQEMIKILKQSSYILINYNSNEDHNNGISCSGSLQLALSTLCKPIMVNTSNKYLQIENAFEFDIASDEQINIDGEIDFKAIDEERNKYVDKFEYYLNNIQSTIYLRILSDRFSSNNMEDWMETDKLFYMYNKPVILTKKDNYTHCIIINVGMPKLNINKNKVVGISHEPTLPEEPLRSQVIEYAKKNMQKYFIGDKNNLPEPFIEGQTFMFHNKTRYHNIPKTKFCSIVISKKQCTSGHKYRHKLVEAILKTDLPIDIYGYGVETYKKKMDDTRLKYSLEKTLKDPFGTDPFIDYKFHICIENMVSNNYFSEKIVNPLLSNIIPIYYGCKKIDNYFDNIIKLTGNIEQDINLLKKIFEKQHMYINTYNSDKILDKCNMFYNLHTFFDDIKLKDEIIIPKKLFQTWEHSNIEPDFQEIIDIWKNNNLDYEYIFHDSGQRLKFIEENFEENVVNAYNKIIPGAYKCDLWRYCVLYIYGGFYADIDTLCMGKLNDLISDNIDFIVPIDLNINPTEGQYNLACGFIGSVPKSPILLDAINRIVDNVENNIIPPSKLDFSGPGVLGRSVNKFLKLEETSSFNRKHGIKNTINFLHFDPQTEYITDVNTNKIILQNKNKNSEIIRLYNNECNKIKNYTCWVSSNKIIK